MTLSPKKQSVVAGEGRSYRIKQETMFYYTSRHITKNAVPTSIGCRTAFFDVCPYESSSSGLLVSTTLGKEI